LARLVYRLVSNVDLTPNMMLRDIHGCKSGDLSELILYFFRMSGPY
jgi:hypothetical protein